MAQFFGTPGTTTTSSTICRANIYTALHNITHTGNVNQVQLF